MSISNIDPTGFLTPPGSPGSSGYVPFECPEEPVGKLRHFKLVNGLSYERLGKMMDRDPEQLTDWLSGRVKPTKRNIQNIADFLAKNA
ncbi:MAG: helix-turn-helix transcriptional regulator, partial [Nitrospirota bacterium]|nr:helix-turn-helix transcriptional regulator [Nitrospirota bacterium]